MRAQETRLDGRIHHIRWLNWWPLEEMTNNHPFTPVFLSMKSRLVIQWLAISITPTTKQVVLVENLWPVRHFWNVWNFFGKANLFWYTCQRPWSLVTSYIWPHTCTLIILLFALAMRQALWIPPPSLIKITFLVFRMVGLGRKCMILSSFRLSWWMLSFVFHHTSGTLKVGNPKTVCMDGIEGSMGFAEVRT